MSDHKREPGADESAPGGSRFVGKHDTVEDKLKMETVGLVRLEDFQRKREEVLAQRRRESELEQQRKEEKRAKRRKEQARSAAALSFSLDEDAEEAAPPPKRRVRSVRNPEVDTSYLPDRERADAERREREELRGEWHERQNKLKAEEIHIDFAYWDGSAHPAAADTTKGENIGAFLERCRAQVPALKSTPIEQLMYIKVRTC